MLPFKEYYVTVKFTGVVQVEHEYEIPDEMKAWFDDVYGIDFDYELTWEPVHVCSYENNLYCQECGLICTASILKKDENGIFKKS